MEGTTLAPSSAPFALLGPGAHPGATGSGLIQQVEAGAVPAHGPVGVVSRGWPTPDRGAGGQGRGWWKQGGPSEADSWPIPQR